MAESKSNYIPALSFKLLTPLYDPLLRWGMREETFKRQLIQLANLRSGQSVLDLGCGTGTLTLMLKQSAPAAHITGLDGDEEVLSIARAKAQAAGLSIQWDHGMAYKLPYPGNSFDVVISSLVMHHLTTPDKARAFHEVHRVLRQAGQLLILDFGPPFSAFTRFQAMAMRNLEEAADNFDGRLPGMLREAGFDAVIDARLMNTVFGPLWMFQAVKREGLPPVLRGDTSYGGRFDQS